MRKILEVALALVLGTTAALAQISPSKVITVRTSCTGSCPQDGLFCLDKDDSKLYRCTSGSWSFLADLGHTGDMSQSTYDPDSDGTVESADVALNADMKRSVYDTDTDSMVDAAEGLAAVSAWAVRYEDRDTDGDGTPDFRVCGDYDGDGTLEWIDDVIQAFVDWCAASSSTVDLHCGRTHAGECEVWRSDQEQRTVALDLNGDGTANDPWCGTFIILPGRYRTASGERFFRTDYTGYTIRAYGVIVDLSDLACSELLGDTTATELSPFAVNASHASLYGKTSPVTFEGLTIIGAGARQDLDAACDIGDGVDSCTGRWCPGGWYNGLWTEGVDDVTVRDYVARDIDRQGLDIESGDRVYIENVVVHGSGEHCLAIARNGETIVAQATLTNCGGINDGGRGDALVWIPDSSSYRDRDLYGVTVTNATITNSLTGFITEINNTRPGTRVTVEGLTCIDVDNYCTNITTGTSGTAELANVVLRDVHTEGGAHNAIWVAPPGADYTRLKNVLIENVTITDPIDGTTSPTQPYAMNVGAVNLVVRNARIKDTTGRVTRGIRTYLCEDCTIEDTLIELSADGAYGIGTYRQRGTLRLRDVTVRAIGGTDLWGVQASGIDATTKMGLDVEGLRIEEDGGTFFYGVKTDYLSVGRIIGADISISSSTASAYGIYNWSATDFFEVASSRVVVSTSASSRALNIRNTTTVMFTGNYLDAPYEYIRANEATSGVVLGNTLGGSATSGTPYYTFADSVLVLDQIPGDTWETWNALRFKPRSTGPTCDAGHEGAVYYDSDLNELCYCDGSSWQQVDGGGGC